MENLKNINEALFELYGRIYANKQFLTDKQYKYMCACLFEQYEVNYKIYALKKRIDDKTTIFSLKKNASLRIPFSFIFITNRIARLIVKDIKKDFDKYCKDLSNSSEN